VHGPQKGLDLLETLDGAGGLEGHHRLDYLNTQAARLAAPDLAIKEKKRARKKR
jgi:hypothetical protein